MAVGSGLVLFYAELCRRYDLGGRCLVLGRQDVHLTFDMLCTLMVRAGYFIMLGDVVRVPPALDAIKRSGDHLSQKPALRQQDFISHKAVFAALGFLETDSVDVSAYEGADFLHDLNQPGLVETVG